MTLQIQTGRAVNEVVQSALMQLQQEYNVLQISLYQGQQVVSAVGEPVWRGRLPDTWQTQKVQNESGETWFWPLMVRGEGWGWLVSHWRANVNPEIEPEWELFTAHLGLIIQANGWENHHQANHVFPEFSVLTNEDKPYHFLLNHLPVGVAFTDAAGCCIYANEYLTQQLFQMSAQEMMGWGWTNAIHADDRERVTQAWQRAVHTPPHEYAEEYRLQRRDGSVIWIRANALVLRNPTGEVMGFIGISMPRKPRLLRLIIGTIHESLDIAKTLPVVLNETRATLACDRVVIYRFNPDWSGYFLAESVGDGWVPVVTGSMTTLSDHCLQETQGGRFQQHYVLVSHDIYQSGFSPCHIKLLEQFQARAQVVIPIFLEQKLWGLLAAYQNSAPRIWHTDTIEILQQVGLHLAIAIRQNELYQAAQAQVVELQKLNTLKDEFLSTVSHELRSPIHNIGMAIKMLELRLQRAGILTDLELNIEPYLHILKTATQRETNLINDLLDLARLNANAVDLILEPVDIQPILARLLPAIQERAEAQNQNFTVHLPEHFCPFPSHADSLERILQELLHNACKYTPAQERITLAIAYQQDTCEFRVTNTGVEIPPDSQERVFDKFYRIPRHDPWAYGGTGLGLALVKKLVERLHGKIHLMSENNRTEFRVSFPLNTPRSSE